MKKLYLLLVLFSATVISAQNTDLCTPTTFLREISYPSQPTQVYGKTICPSGDGNLFMAVDWRSFGPNPLLIKVTPDGEVLWSRLFFWDQYSYFYTTITSMMVDTEGMLIISGYYITANSNEAEDFICRYDPVQNIVRWAKRLPVSQPESDHNIRILEKQPNGNYLLYRTLITGFYDEQETEMIEINRQTGTIIGAAPRKIGLEGRSVLTSIITYQGNLYAAGTQTEGDASSPGKNLLCKMNMEGSQMLWANVGLGIPEKVINGGLLIDQDTLVSLYYGRDTLPSGQHTSGYIYLQKTTLDGQLVWVQRYDLQGQNGIRANAIINTPTGYIIFGRDFRDFSYGIGQVESNFFFISTDKAGHTQSTNWLPAPSDRYFANFDTYIGTGIAGDYAAVIGDAFYFLGTFSHYTDHYSYEFDFSNAILLKSDLALNDLDGCPFAPLGYPIIETSIPNPTATPIPLTITPSTATVQNFTMYTAPDSAVVTTTCARCDAPCGPILSLGPDQEFFQDTTVLLQAGTGFISYRWQDGSTAPTYLAAAGGTYWVEVKDGCGFVQRDTVQLSLSETVCDSKDQACIHWDLLDVKATATGDLRFRIKLTNNCTSNLQQIDIQVPSGVIATQPANQSIYAAPSSGRSYTVRNPNFSPFYSLRFRANAGSALSNGAADIFTYDLPGQAQPDYIHTQVKLANGSSYEAHLNTFNCPPAEAANREKSPARLKENILSPNPSNGTLWFYLPDWQQQIVQVRILNTQGQTVQRIELTDREEQRTMQLTARLANGLYYAVLQGENQAPLTLRFVLER